MIKIFILLLIYSSAVTAQNNQALNNNESYKKQDYPLDWKYHAGEYLIYDCERAHYACVNKEGNDNCREERSEAIEKKLPQYPCAPLKKFENKKECVKENYHIQDIGAKKRFCYPKT